MNLLGLSEAELLEAQYSALLDSVGLLQRLLDKPYKSEADIDSIRRNTEHLSLMLEKLSDQSFDLNPVRAVIDQVNEASLIVSVDPAPSVVSHPHPSRAKLHELASGSIVWQHISQYAPIQSLALYTALVGSSTLNESILLQNVRDLMAGVIQALGTENALTGQPVQTESGEVTMADILDSWLAAAFFDFRYADLIR